MTGDRHDNDATIDSFVAAMKHELGANEWKGGWSEDTPGHRVWEVLYHALKLGLAVMGDEDPALCGCPSRVQAWGWRLDRTLRLA